MRLWGGRTDKEPDPAFARLNASIGTDLRLFNEDIDGSRAWANALGRAGVLTGPETDAILEGLEWVRHALGDPDFKPLPTDEDIHTAIERLLTERIGEPAGKLHTGRSRNDQVATSFRLWVMRGCERIDAAIVELAGALVEQAKAGVDLPMPGYTHLRPAQPVTWGHWVLSHFWPLMRSRDRFTAARASAAVLPLGSAALAGSTIEVDRQAIADELGFEAVSPNSIDAVADRDFAVEFLFAASLLGIELSRLSEALILFSGPEFGYLRLDPAYTTGSSLMPHKQNPDALELARGKSGRLLGSLTGLMATLKGLPSAYDKDLQEDKPPVFAAHDTVLELLAVLSGLIATLEPQPDRMAAAITPDLLAADLADYLVGKGLAFRRAHSIATTAVALAEQHQVPLDQLPLNDLQALDPHIEPDVANVFDLETALKRRSLAGGTAPSAVKRQLAAAEAALQREL